MTQERRMARQGGGRPPHPRARGARRSLVGRLIDRQRLARRRAPRGVAAGRAPPSADPSAGATAMAHPVCRPARMHCCRPRLGTLGSAWMKRVGVRAGGRPTATALQPLQCLRRCHRALRCLIGPGAGPLESSRRALRERVEFKRRGEGEGEVEVEVDSEGCGGPRGEVAVLRATSPPWVDLMGLID